MVTFSMSTADFVALVNEKKKLAGCRETFGYLLAMHNVAAFVFGVESEAYDFVTGEIDTLLGEG